MRWRAFFEDRRASARGYKRNISEHSAVLPINRPTLMCGLGVRKASSRPSEVMASPVWDEKRSSDAGKCGCVIGSSAWLVNADGKSSPEGQVLRQYSPSQPRLLRVWP